MSEEDITLWIIAGLVAIFGFMFVQHLSADREFRALVTAAIEKLHEIDRKVASLLQRWIDHDREKK